MELYAEVAVNRPVNQTFHYHIPPALTGNIQPGHMVEVSWGTALMTGVVLALSDDSPVPETKPIRRRLDPDPVLTPLQIELAWWLARYTLTPIGPCVWLMLPPGLAGQSEIIYRLMDESDPGNTTTQKRIISLLKNRGDLNNHQLRRALPRTNWQAAMQQLTRRGVVESEPNLRPPAVSEKHIRTVRLAIPAAAIRGLGPQLGRESKRAAVLEVLRATDGQSLRCADVMEIAGCGLGPVDAVIEAELVEVTEEGASKAERQLTLTLSPPETRQQIIALRGAGKYLDILDFIASWPEADVPVSEIYAHTDSTNYHLKRLARDGFIVIGEMEVIRDPLDDEAAIDRTLPPPLTPGQVEVWEAIRHHQTLTHWEGATPDPDTPHVFLLHGVTGSGKTEIYMRAVAQALAQGRQAVVLVPEIALTAQLGQRFRSRFPGQVAVVHSGLSMGERYDTWRRARAGDVPIILGARSALFTPLPDVGLVVLDEEHDDSYKQSPPIAPPHYHARAVAVEMMRRNRGTLILGSATPDVESMYRARQGDYALLKLPDRVMARRDAIVQQTARLNLPEARYHPAETEAAMMTELPPVEIVDMRQELRAGNRSIFSRALQKRLGQVLDRQEQALLFLNRRGTATFVMCRACGYIAHCPRCDTALTYHAPHEALTCHHCAFRTPNLSTCPECGSDRIRYFGSGTEQIDRLLQEEFPQARVLRWDQDTASEKGAHERILRAFTRREADVLVGTQMIAKGLDIPLVTLVGVISADTALGLPDYRTGERTFQLLTQVAGRAGRGLLAGHAIFQTYQPEHYAIQAAARHDYAAFYEHEIAFRQATQYPPYMELARLLILDRAPDAAQHEAERVAEIVRNHIQHKKFAATAAVGPTPCFYRRRDNYFRWQVLVRSPDVVRVLSGLELPSSAMIDVHPTDLL